MATDGLILRERWVARPGVLEKLNQRFRFAIFTGRPQAGGRADPEPLRAASWSSIRSSACTTWRTTSRARRPARHPQRQRRFASSYYVGDTVDDARCARAAGVPFIGIAAPSNPRYLDLVFLFQAEGAFAIVDDINYLEEVFAS